MEVDLNNMDKFLIGVMVGIGSFMLFEPLVINFIYFTNLDLFNAIILTEKNRKKIRSYYEKNN